MGKSLDFVKDRYPKVSQLSFREDAKWNELKFSTFNLLEQIKRKDDGSLSVVIKFDEDGKEEDNINVTIKYDSDGDFEYFTTESCRNDGTLLFARELIDDIIWKILKLQSFNSHTCPKEALENPKGWDVEFTVGDFVWVSEFGDEFATDEKPWMRQKDTMMLPIKSVFRKR